MPRLNARHSIWSAWRLAFAAGIALAAISFGEVKAHFLWLTCERETPTAPPSVRAFLSETPVPAGPEFLKHIEKATITAGGHTLSWSKQEDTYRVNLPKAIPGAIDGFCDLGVMKRGEQTFRLVYTARVQFEPSNAADHEAGDFLRARLEKREGQASVVTVRFRGKPASAPWSKRIQKRATRWKSKPTKKVGYNTRVWRKDEPGSWSNGSRNRRANWAARRTARSATTRA